MSFTTQSRCLKSQHLLNLKHQSSNGNYKKAWHRKVKHEKATKIVFTLIIAAFSFSAVGCNTLQALEPTAILISNIKNVI
ncbi:hypothetical protein ES754_03360 [Psychrobacter frigidicola]|uniref:Uncharacterized protein n=1 Tax=Psychrobacter frigidicola TaxID=45611 RepID=A0A5C7A6A5_9GAMM|nr:hypothetical protein [Psychrobacter frigidicola]TXD98004.1 hypothetical protein ES754_03360 [Psychrobacter frigidicola]